MELRVSNRSQLPAQEGLKAKWSTHMPVAFSVHVWRQAQSLQVSKEAGAKDSRRSHRVGPRHPGSGILWLLYRAWFIAFRSFHGLQEASPSTFNLLHRWGEGRDCVCTYTHTCTGPISPTPMYECPVPLDLCCYCPAQ